MRRALRENGLCALSATAGCAAIAWLGLYGAAWNDYEVESRPAVEALVHGHLGAFLRLAPVYGGSLIERAPFALIGGLWHGGPLATYRLLAVPCLLAAAILGVLLAAQMRGRGRSTLARAVTLGVCVANPVALRALELGHAEELLGASLCVVAVLVAGAEDGTRRRALLAGLLLGLAVANKQWAVLAAGPVLLALAPGRRLAAAASAIGVAAVVQAPLLLGSSGGFAAGAGAAAAPGSAIFQPWQLWWFLGHHGPLVHGLDGLAKPGYRVAPSWPGLVSHPLILLVGLALAGALWVGSRGRRVPAARALLALAVALLARCLLDTWDTVYYLLPAIFAVVGWESLRDSRQPPVIALALSVLAWAQFQWLAGRVSPDAQSALFLAWALPLTVWLGVRLFTGPPLVASGGGLSPAPRRRSQPTTVRSLRRPVSASQPSAATTVRSSIRTPSTPGR
jgi:hypothetical protein